MNYTNKKASKAYILKFFVIYVQDIEYTKDNFIFKPKLLE